jgi:predicted TIM-barrel fold metal-dependent hydrolase
VILDMQIHFWEAQRPDRPWARDIPASLPEPFGPERFLPMMDTAGVDRAVIVPPAYVFPSNAYGLECARAYPNRFGVMGLIDLRQPDVEEQVAGWRAQPGMLGLRISLTARGRSLWSDEAAVERFWAACERDALPVTVMAAGATDYVERLLKRHPALALCIDHLGLPLIDAPADDEGFVRFLALARYPQLVAKISTLPARSTTGYPFSEVHDLARRAYEAFGPERLLWGSDHTQTLGRGRATYAEELRLFTEALDFLDDQERRAMLGENALHYLRWPADVRSTGVKE